MKDKILVWIDDIPIHFGIAKFFHENNDCDMYGIFDVDDQQKNFYESQNLLKFKKIWFFRDYLSKSDIEPDFEYLKNFERKYQINLWQLAYSEREFLHYNELYKFSTKEILNILQQECQFFEKILSEIKPDFLFIKTTDYLENTLLHEISKAMGVRTLMLGSTKLSSTKIMISSNYDQVDDFLEQIDEASEPKNSIKSEKHEDQKQKSESFLKSFDEFQKKGPKVKSWKKPARTLKIVTNIDKKNYKEFYSNYQLAKLKSSLIRLSGIARTKKLYRKKFLDQNSMKKIDPNQPYVYFPLHVEPERNMLLSAPFYTNQIELISNIAKSLPAEYVLLVKEHPLMKFKRWRKVSYYKNILALPNVGLIHPDVSIDNIFKTCSLVVTISGSSAIQAAFYEKPTIVFSDTIYSKLPFVYRIKNIEDLPKIIRKCITEKFDYSLLQDFVSFMDKHTFEVDLFEMAANAKNRFYFGGTLNYTHEISEDQMMSFLDESASKFELLSNEHAKKIKQWKIHNGKISIN